MIQINGTIGMSGPIADDLLGALVSMMKASRAEEGCLEYSFGLDISDPSTVVLFERWRDKAALAAHNASPHMAEFQKAMAANPPASRDLRIFETDEGRPL